jgi:hypothetical protein
MAPVVLAVPLLAENRVGRTTPVALVVLLLKEDLDLTASLMVQGRMVPVVLVVPLLREDLDLTAGHMVRGGHMVRVSHMVRVGHTVRVRHMVARPSRKGGLDRTANQISTTKANQISTTRRGSAGRRGLLGLRWLSGQSRCAVAFL